MTNKVDKKGLIKAQKENQNQLSPRIPQRKCIVCGNVTDKSNLVRIGRDSGGRILTDLKGRLPGRGAYLCTNTDCIKRAFKKKSLNRAFGVSVSEEVYREIEDFIQLSLRERKA